MLYIIVSRLPLRSSARRPARAATLGNVPLFPPELQKKQKRLWL